MAAQWPLIKARLVELLPTLPGWDTIAIYPGRLTTGSPPDQYATVGYDSDGQTGSYTLEQNPSGFQWNETGAVHCEVNCSTGSDDPLITEAMVQAALDGIDGAVRADRRLGVLAPESTAVFTVLMAPAASNNGTAYLARFALNYFTVT